MAASGFCPGGEHAECFVAIDSLNGGTPAPTTKTWPPAMPTGWVNQPEAKPPATAPGEIHCDGGFWDGGGRNGFCRRLIRAYIDEFHGNKDDESEQGSNADPKKDDPKNGEPKNAEPKRTMPRTTATGKTRNPAGPCRPRSTRRPFHRGIPGLSAHRRAPQRYRLSADEGTLRRGRGQGQTDQGLRLDQRVGQLEHQSRLEYAVVVLGRP